MSVLFGTNMFVTINAAMLAEDDPARIVNSSVYELESGDDSNVDFLMRHMIRMAILEELRAVCTRHGLERCLEHTGGAIAAQAASLPPAEVERILGAK